MAQNESFWCRSRAGRARARRLDGADSSGAPRHYSRRASSDAHAAHHSDTLASARARRQSTRPTRRRRVRRLRSPPPRRPSADRRRRSVRRRGIGRGERPRVVVVRHVAGVARNAAAPAGGVLRRHRGQGAHLTARERGVLQQSPGREPRPVARGDSAVPKGASDGARDGEANAEEPTHERADVRDAQGQRDPAVPPHRGRDRGHVQEPARARARRRGEGGEGGRRRGAAGATAVQLAAAARRERAKKTPTRRRNKSRP